MRNNRKGVKIPRKKVRYKDKIYKTKKDFIEANCNLHGTNYGSLKRLLYRQETETKKEDQMMFFVAEAYMQNLYKIYKIDKMAKEEKEYFFKMEFRMTEKDFIKLIRPKDSTSYTFSKHLNHPRKPFRVLQEVI